MFTRRGSLQGDIAYCNNTIDSVVDQEDSTTEPRRLTGRITTVEHLPHPAHKDAQLLFLHNKLDFIEQCAGIEIKRWVKSLTRSLSLGMSPSLTLVLLSHHAVSFALVLA